VLVLTGTFTMGTTVADGDVRFSDFEAASVRAPAPTNKTCTLGELCADATFIGLGWGLLANRQVETLTLSVSLNLSMVQAPCLSFQSWLVSAVLLFVGHYLDVLCWQGRNAPHTFLLTNYPQRWREILVMRDTELLDQ
jgi:hypothetical protein